MCEALTKQVHCFSDAVSEENMQTDTDRQSQVRRFDALVYKKHSFKLIVNKKTKRFLYCKNVLIFLVIILFI